MNPAKAISLTRILIGFIGIFLAVYLLPDTEGALRVIATLLVGVVGLLAFISHVIFHRADAARLGWDEKNPGWQLEVGFANLAFGAAALIAVAGNWGFESLALITIGYTIYLLQAAVLHCYNYFHETGRPFGYLVRSSLLTMVYVAAMLVFTFMVMMDNHIWPL